MTTLIDNLGNIVVGGETDYNPNFIASFTESGTINFSMLFSNSTYGNEISSMLSTSDNGIIGLSFGASGGGIQVTKYAAYIDKHIFSSLIQQVQAVEGTLTFLYNSMEQESEPTVPFQLLM
jgi:hypothetical protein